MAVWLLGAVALVIVAGSAVWLLFLTREDDVLEKLGVSKIYPRSALPASKIEAYLELKDKLREQYAKGADSDVQWMSQLPQRDKEMLKYRLMQRAISDMAALQKIDADARGYWKLFSRGVITRTFWNSVMEAEKDLSQELESVKAEAAAVEPTQDPQGIISEAMQFVIRFGDKFPAAADVAGGADMFAEMLRHLPAPGQLGPGGRGAGPPMMGPPGMGMCPPGGPGGPGGGPCMPPGLGPHGHPGMGPPRGPMPSQPAGGECEAYSWKQDGDELEVSVKVPGAASKAKVKVTFAARKLRVEHEGAVLVEGQLAAVCRPEGSTWTLSKDRVVVSLEKADARPWPALFTG